MTNTLCHRLELNARVEHIYEVFLSKDRTGSRLVIPWPSKPGHKATSISIMAAKRKTKRKSSKKKPRYKKRQQRRNTRQTYKVQYRRSYRPYYRKPYRSYYRPYVSWEDRNWFNNYIRSQNLLREAAINLPDPEDLVDEGALNNQILNIPAARNLLEEALLPYVPGHIPIAEAYNPDAVMDDVAVEPDAPRWYDYAPIEDRAPARIRAREEEVDDPNPRPLNMQAYEDFVDII